MVCDPGKLDAAGCLGTPDLIVEILSPGNNHQELKIKFDLYEEVDVKESWVVYPVEQSLIIHSLVSGKYLPSRPYTAGDVVISKVITGFQLDLGELF